MSSKSTRNKTRTKWYGLQEASNKFGVRVSLLSYRARKHKNGSPFIVEGVRFVASDHADTLKVAPHTKITCAHCERELTRNRTRTVNGNAACYDCWRAAFRAYDNDARRALGLSVVSVAEMNATFKFT